MQNVQVPVWAAVVVTFGVALVGAAGPIAAQFVNAWRESKKSVREEAYKRVSHWRDRRLEIYGDLVELAYKAAHHHGQAAVTSEHDERMDSMGEARAAMREIEHLRSRLLIVTTQEVYTQYQKVRDHLDEAYGAILDLAEAEVTPGREVSNEHAKTTMKEANTTISELVRAIRHDLGVPDWM